MRELILFILLISVISIKSQSLTDRKINKLSKLNVEINNLDFTDFAIQKDLNRILKLERKRKINKAVGVLFSLMSITGIYLAYKGGGRHYLKTPIVYVAGGLVYGAISIPFWVSSKKQKKERDRLIKMYDRPLE